MAVGERVKGKFNCIMRYIDELCQFYGKSEVRKIFWKKVAYLFLNAMYSALQKLYMYDTDVFAVDVQTSMTFHDQGNR